MPGVVSRPSLSESLTMKKVPDLSRLVLQSICNFDSITASASGSVLKVVTGSLSLTIQSMPKSTPKSKSKSKYL